MLFRSTINFDVAKDKTIKLFSNNIENITSEKLKNSINKYLEYLKNSKVSDWDKENAQKYLRGNIAHTLLFNDIDLPEKMSFINEIMTTKLPKKLL